MENKMKSRHTNERINEVNMLIALYDTRKSTSIKKLINTQIKDWTIGLENSEISIINFCLKTGETAVCGSIVAQPIATFIENKKSQRV